MMRRKKAERKRQRRRRGDGIDIINDDDGRIAAMVELMKNATKVGIYFTFNVFFIKLCNRNIVFIDNRHF